MNIELALLRFFLRVPKPRVQREEALLIARQECDRRGVPWIQPIAVSEGLRWWNITLNAGSVGCNIFIRVDAITGQIVGIAGLLPSEREVGDDQH